MNWSGGEVCSRRSARIGRDGSLVFGLCLALALSWRVDGQAAVATPKEILAGAVCAEAAMSLLATWGSINEFVPAPSREGVVVFRSATHDIGVWVIVRVADGRVDRLARVSADGESTAAVDERCRIRSSERVNPGVTDGAALLTDHDVETILADRTAGVFYAWSPHMPLSVDGLNEILVAGKRLGIAVTPVLSGHANSRYARESASRLALPETAFRTSRSVELEMRDFNVHAPALLIYDDGRFVSPVIPGFRRAADYEALIVRFLPPPRR